MSTIKLKIKAVVLPGQVVLFVKNYGSRGSDQHHPVFANVVAVNRGALTVHDASSVNGLAKIICHGDSDSGKYWYEYTDKETGKGISCDVKFLYVCEHDVTGQIKGIFIKETT